MKTFTTLAVIFIDGQPTLSRCGVNQGNALKKLQGIVNGYIERVSVRNPRFPRGLSMWVNENGMPLGLPLHSNPFYPGPIAGNYVITRLDEEGDFAAVTEDDIAVVSAAVMED